MHNAMATMGGFQTERKRTVRLAVEVHAMRFQRGNDFRACRHNLRSHAPVTQAVASRNRIGQMQRRAVIRANTCGNAALRQHAGTGQAEASRCHQQHRLRR